MLHISHVSFCKARRIVAWLRQHRKKEFHTAWVSHCTISHITCTSKEGFMLHIHFVSFCKACRIVAWLRQLRKKSSIQQGCHTVPLVISPVPQKQDLCFIFHISFVSFCKGCRMIEATQKKSSTQHGCHTVSLIRKLKIIWYDSIIYPDFSPCHSNSFE